MSKIHQLKEEFIDTLLRDLKDPERDPRVYETIRAFLKDWKSEIDNIPDVLVNSGKNSMDPPPFRIGSA